MIIYQNEKVLMRALGLIKKAEITVVRHETVQFEGTAKEIQAEVDRQSNKPGVAWAFGYDL